MGRLPLGLTRLLLVCALAGAPSAALASPLDETQGVRSKAMGGAHRGLGTSNDAIYMNPAGMALGVRYNVQLQFAYSPFDELSHANMSAVDSKSGPMAGGLAYTYDRGDETDGKLSLHRLYGSTAYALSNNIAVGLTLKHVRGSLFDGDEQRDVSLYTGDVGLLAKLSSGLGLGITAHNIVPTDVERLTPLTIGVGLGYERLPVALAADVEIDLRLPDDPMLTYAAGAEYFLAGSYPVRAGFRRAPFKRKNGEWSSEDLITGGLGWLSGGGAITLSGFKSLDRPDNWGFIAALEFFL